MVGEDFANTFFLKGRVDVVVEILGIRINFLVKIHSFITRQYKPQLPSADRSAQAITELIHDEASKMSAQDDSMSHSVLLIIWQYGNIRQYI